MVRFAAISAILLSAVTTYNAVVAEATSRRLSFDSYAGYLPSTQITDIAAIDLDQLTLNEQLSGGKLNNALSVYKEGGHSGSYALLGITNSGTSDYSFVAGAQVTGVAENGQNVTGVLMSDVTWGKHTQQHFINVKYSNGDSQATYVDCQVGGLYYFHGANRGGCKFIKRILYYNLKCLARPHSQFLFTRL